MAFRKSNIPTPVYYQLQVEVKNKIESGEWKPGSMIPPERTFTDDYQVSIGTVKKALTNLVNEGYLKRIQGKGTFVTGTTLRRDQLRYYRLHNDFSDEGSEIEVKLLDVEAINGENHINRNLKLRTNQKLFRVRRILLSDNAPLIYSISFLPQKLFKGLIDLPQTRFEKDTLYLLLEEEYGVPTVSNRELIGAVSAEKEIATFLKVKKGTPLVKVEMLSYTYKEQPYEYRYSYCLTNSRKIFREY